MPDGSSSEAPVTSPGPRARRYLRHAGPPDARVVSARERPPALVLVALAIGSVLAPRRASPTGWGFGDAACPWSRYEALASSIWSQVSPFAHSPPYRTTLV